MAENLIIQKEILNHFKFKQFINGLIKLADFCYYLENIILIIDNSKQIFNSTAKISNII